MKEIRFHGVLTILQLIVLVIATITEAKYLNIVYICFMISFSLFIVAIIKEK